MKASTEEGERTGQQEESEQDRLQRSERRLRALAEAAAEIVWFTDAAGNVIEPLPPLERFTGRSFAELAGRGWMGTIHPHDVESLLSAWRASSATTSNFAIEYRMRRADGEYRFMRARAAPVLGDDGSVVEWVGVNVDVTQKRAIELELRESEQRLALIFNSAFDSMFLMSVEPGERFVLRLVNASFTRITGVAPELVIDKEIREIAREQAAVQVTRYEEAKRGRVVVEFEERYELMGREQVMETRLIPVIDPAGVVTHILGTSRDISERRRIETERQALTAQLQHAQKLESLGVLAGGVAHDFNNLLVGILGNASLAMLDLEPGSDLAETVSDIERTARHAADLTNQLLAYSGKGRFVVSAVDLGRLVRDMAPVWRSALSKRARVVLEAAEPLPPVEADGAQLQQVVLNMMTNASDALGDGTGTIILRTGTVRLDEGALRAARFSTGASPGEFVYMEVEDDGSGMTDDTIARIFDPFFTTRFTGRGLGLAATLGIVRGHHGVITVGSAPGEGTTFRVALPARADLVAARATPARGTLTIGAGTVLVIDDESGVRTAVQRILERAGYETMAAAEGADGIALFAAHRDQIDCVVVDLTMPGLGGVEVVAAIRAIRADVRVVVASGFDARTVRGLEPIEHVFLHKPFTATQLIEAVGPGHGS